jgi:superfamily I DNA/RNA helicase
MNNLHAMNFHELCYWRIQQVKKTFSRDLLIEARENYPFDNEFEVLYPDAFINSLDISPLQYDVIIVDEGQDFTDEYWLAVDMLMESQTNDINLYIFQDGNQAIYSSSDELPIDEVPLYLTDNCRNTKTIHDAAYKFYKGEEIDKPSIDGEPIEFLCDESLEKQAFLIDKKLLSSLVKKTFYQKI